MSSTDPDLLRVRELFEATLDLPREARSAFLDERSRGDPSLRARVESLLHHDEEAAGFLSRTSLEGALELNVERWIGRTIGGFSIRSLLARGGMGVVFEAEQTSPHRLVALKMLRRSHGAESSHKRFRLEVEVLGLLKHPGIAQIHGAGTLRDGGESVPYIAMELVEDARTLPRFADEHGLSEAQRLALFRDACEAVDYGHRKGIVHRDLKPGNVLVDRDGNVKVIDFGVARVLDPSLVRASLVETVQGGLLGTLEYMSPEHVAGAPLDVDVRSDVYSLGCILGELLGGTPPRDFDGLSIAAAVQRLQTEEPTIPSGVAPELRWILIKALERAPERRYPSALALSEDVERYLRHESVQAVRPTALYQLAKFSRRNRVLLVATAVVLLALSFGLHRARTEAAHARESARIATEESALARTISGFLSDLFQSSNAYRHGPDGKTVDMIEEAARRLDGVAEPRAHAVLASLVAEGLVNLEAPGRARELLAPAWEWMRSELPASDPDRLHAGAVWVDILERLGEYEASLAENEPLFRTATQFLPVRDADRLYLGKNLATLYERLGRHAEAEPILRALALEADTPEQETDVLLRIGHSLSRQGRESQAADTYARALELAEGFDGSDSLYATVIRMDLAATLMRLGARDEAERALRRCLVEMEQRGAPPSNRFIVRTDLVALAVERADAGEEIDLEELEGWVAEAAGYLPSLESEPGRFQLSWLNLEAARLRVSGEPEASERAATEALALSGRIYGDHHPQALALFGSLAAAREAGGDVEGALAATREGLESIAAASGRGSHPWRALLRNRIATLERAERLEEALALATELIETTPSDSDDIEPNRALLDGLRQRVDAAALE